MKALPKGIYYKVLAEGNAQSATPSVRSIVTAHYTGRTINGKTFDSSRGGAPLAIRLCDLIEGWIIAMQQMHIGDKWEPITPLLWLLLTSHGKLYYMVFVNATSHHVREISSDKSFVFPSYTYLIYYVCSR